MKKRIFSRLMAMVMAVALLSTNAFAAVALEKDRHIGEDGTLLSHKETNESNEEFDSYDYYLEDDVELDQTLVINAGVEANIELNGHTICLNKDLEIKYDQTDRSCEIQVPEGEDLKEGPVINVWGTLSVTDSTAEKDEKGNYIKSGTGAISGGAASSGCWGGGVLVEGGIFKMEGGNISNNVTTSGHGGGIAGSGCQEISLTGTTLSGNYSKGHGGAMAVFTWVKPANISLDQVTVRDNCMGTLGSDAILVQDSNGGTFSLTNSVVKDNYGYCAAGVHLVGIKKENITLDNNAICNNHSGHEEQNSQLWTGYDDLYEKESMHIWIKEVPALAPTCTEAGHEAGRICKSGCVEGMAPIPATGHHWTNVPAEEPTCTEPGHEAGKVCTSGCQEGLEEIPATGHQNTEWRVTTPAQPGIPGVETEYCLDCGQPTGNTRPIPALPMPIDFGDGTGGSAGGDTTISDEATPLAGLFTRADAIGYLWEQSGSPEAELSTFADVPEDHYWAVAIGWAEDNGIALPDEEGNFRPDDLVLRTSDEPEGELQEFLNRYAVFAGVELNEGELFFVLDGTADDVIMGEDAQVIFDAFFAKLEKTLAGQEKAA